MKMAFLLTACGLLVVGCVSARGDERSLPIQPAAPVVGSDTNDTRSMWLREFSVSVEARCNALLASRVGAARITVEGVTAGFAEEGSSNITMIAVSILAEQTDTNLIQAVRQGVLRAMKLEEICRAEVAFKRGHDQPPVRTIVILDESNNIPAVSAPRISQ